MKTKRQLKAHPVWLSADGHKELRAVRALALRLGVERLPPEARSVYEAAPGGVTLTSTVHAALTVFKALLNERLVVLEKGGPAGWEVDTRQG